MVAMRHPNQFLQNRNGHWHYVRRVPELYRDFDQRTFSRASLRTTALEVARARRDAMVEADDLYWASLTTRTGRSAKPKTDPALIRYRAARKRALARGFVYTPIDDLSRHAALDDILTRLKEVEKRPTTRESEAEALLGAVEPVSVSISAAFELYCDKIAISDIRGKSEAQIRSWRKVKQRAVSNFIKLYGDLRMDEITRKHAKDFYAWWGDRIQPKNGEKPLHPNSANRDIGNLRTLYQAYWDFEGEENRENPFRKLRFRGVEYKDIPPFEADWLLSKIMKPGMFDGLNEDATLIIYAMIETGCRPSEIANLLPENIVLDHEVPYLQIRHRGDRKLKSNSSVRDIPLIGISLEAFKKAPQGFPRYRDKSDNLSALLLKAFRARDLFPTPDHRIYSIRHSYEKRMLEAGIDYGLRCLLMGHHNKRPSYGDGGSLEYRRGEMQKIQLPVSDALCRSLPDLQVDI